jgi:hypothetical protein
MSTVAQRTLSTLPEPDCAGSSGIRQGQIGRAQYDEIGPSHASQERFARSTAQRSRLVPLDLYFPYEVTTN